MSRFKITIPHSAERKIEPDLETKIREKVDSIPGSEHKNIKISYGINRRIRYESLEQVQGLYQNYGGPIVLSYENHSEAPVRRAGRGQRSADQIYDLLLGGRTADMVTLYFKDGLIVSGVLIFNPLKGTGRVLNIEQELSVDFSIDDLRNIRYT